MNTYATYEQVLTSDISSLSLDNLRTRGINATPEGKAQVQRYKKTDSWADEVIEAAIDGTLPTFELGVHEAYLTSVAKEALGMELLIERQPGSLAERFAAAMDLAKTTSAQAPQESTRLMRRGRRNNKVVGEVTNLASHIIRHNCGLPCGPGITSAGWTDSDLKAYPEDMWFNKHENDVLKCLENVVGKYEWADGTSAISFDLTKQYYSPTLTAHLPECTWMSFPHDEFAIHVLVGEGPVLYDVMINQGLPTLRANSPAAYMAANSLLAAIQSLTVQGLVGLPTMTVLTDAPLAAVKKATQREQFTCGIVRTPDVPCPVQIFDNRQQYLSSALLADVRVNTLYLTLDGTVSQGSVAAGDVAPSLVVVHCANGGKSTTGSTMVVRHSHGHGIYLHTTSRTAGLVLRRLQTSRKCAPTMRDGLFSPTTCAALHGDGNGAVFCAVDDKTVSVATILCEMQGEVRTITTRDTYQCFRYVQELAELQNWIVEPCGDGSYIDLSTSDFIIGRIAFKYGPDLGIRWASLLTNIPTSDLGADSEIRMDYGCSGLGRYVLRNYVAGGQFVNCRALRLNKKGIFGHLWGLVLDNKKATLAGTLPVPTNYVIDMEFITRKKDGHLERYVYAAGVAKFENGKYAGSHLVVDDSEAMNEFVRANPKEAKRELDNWRTLKQQNTSGDPLRVVEFIKELTKHPNARVYAKGRDAEEEVLSSQLIGATRLFRRQREKTVSLGEIGPLTDKYEVLARRYNWLANHNPAKECVLFAYAVGLCNSLPQEHEVGMDTINAMQPPSANVQI